VLLNDLKNESQLNKEHLMLMKSKLMKGLVVSTIGLALLAPQARADEPKDSNPPAEKSEPTPTKNRKKERKDPRHPKRSAVYPINGPATGSAHLSWDDRVQRKKSEGSVESEGSFAKVCPKCNGRRWLPFRGVWLGLQPVPVVVTCEECHGDGYVTYDLIRRDPRKVKQATPVKHTKKAPHVIQTGH
jgi:hypothetical protein